MLLMGDEVRRTQRGHNNAYCLDDETSWFNWADADVHRDLLRFTKGLIRFRRWTRLFTSRRFWGESGSARIAWHGVLLNTPDWSEMSRSVAFELSDAAGGDHLHVMLNAYWEPLLFELPPLPPGEQWLRLVDTALAPRDDLADPP